VGRAGSPSWRLQRLGPGAWSVFRRSIDGERSVGVDPALRFLLGDSSLAQHGEHLRRTQLRRPDLMTRLLWWCLKLGLLTHDLIFSGGCLLRGARVVLQYGAVAVRDEG
jgi:hypothetical protein